MPHKLFDYMKAGLPVVVPDFAVEIAPIVKKLNAGICVDPSNTNELTNAFKYLVNNPKETMQMGKNGRDGINDEFNWENECQRLIYFYRELI